jgi:hypothetical protein
MPPMTRRERRPGTEPDWGIVTILRFYRLREIGSCATMILIVRSKPRALQGPGAKAKGTRRSGEPRMSLARAAKALKGLNTARGSYWKKLAWIWVRRHVGWGRRHVGLGSAPRPRCLGTVAASALSSYGEAKADPQRGGDEDPRRRGPSVLL